jgi:hypothetical protein
MQSGCQLPPARRDLLFGTKQQEGRADPAFIALLQQARISRIATLRPCAIACFGVEEDRLTICCTPTAPLLGVATDAVRVFDDVLYVLQTARKSFSILSSCLA